MICLPTFTINLGQMWVNIPYMDSMGYSWISIFVEDDRNPPHLGVYLAQPGADLGINILVEMKVFHGRS